MTAGPTRLRFVTRRRCPLCDAGRERVGRWAPRLGFEVDDVDVDSEPGLSEQYGGRVPVLVVGDRVIAEGRMPGSRMVAGLLRLRLEERAARGGAPSQDN